MKRQEKNILFQTSDFRNEIEEDICRFVTKKVINVFTQPPHYN